jgi:sec-independent protein translocase protein TatA
MNIPPNTALLGLGSTEVIVIFAIVILLFGATKLPQLARGMGRSIKEFRDASRDEPSRDARQKSDVPAKADQPKS